MLLVVTSVNYWAVLVGAIIYMALGALWYSPALFGKSWMLLVGKTEEDVKQGPSPLVYLYAFGCALLMAYALARVFVYVGVGSLLQGVLVAILLWLGFTAATTLPNFLFEDRPLKLFSIESTYPLAAMMVMAVIYVLWS